MRGIRLFEETRWCALSCVAKKRSIDGDGAWREKGREKKEVFVGKKMNHGLWLHRFPVSRSLLFRVSVSLSDSSSTPKVDSTG